MHAMELQPTNATSTKFGSLSHATMWLWLGIKHSIETSTCNAWCTITACTEDALNKHACDALHHVEWTEHGVCPESMVYGPNQDVHHPYDIAHKVFKCNELVPVQRHHLQGKDLDLLPGTMQNHDGLAKSLNE